MNGKWLSRSFFIVLAAFAGAFALSWKLSDAGTFEIVATAAISACFAGKGIEAYQSRK